MIRTREQINRDRARLSELLVQERTRQEMREVIKSETGRELSISTITSDLAQVRKGWLSTQQENYDYYISQELVRLKTLEREAWDQFMDSDKGFDTKHIVEALRKEEMVEVSKTTKKSGRKDLAILKFIADLQKERRKLLGLYPQPDNQTVNNVIVMKGYSQVSPRDWPDAPQKVIDG